MSDLKDHSASAIDACRDGLYQVSSEIWKNPEVGSQEYKAHTILTNYLEGEGFRVDRAYTGIPTAFRAVFGKGRPNLCVFCEYDSLPGIGHACGHNLIAEAGVAAGIGLKAVLEKSGLEGTITVLGSPDEEDRGGKVDLINNGALRDIDVAMMFHPAPYSVLKPIFIAVLHTNITFHGKAAHAAAFPWEGRNALDAAVLAYNSISVFRQQMKPMHSIHGVITNGGAKPNIIPDKSMMEYYIRAPTIKELELLTKKCEECFRGAAMATGCSVDIEQVEHTYYDLQSNSLLAGLFRDNAESLGLVLEDTVEEAGSTDMGNVSYHVPSIHPMLKIGNGEVYHTRAFTGVTNTAKAHALTIKAGKVMANTCIDVLMEDELLKNIKSEFEVQIAKEKSEKQ